MSTAAAASEHPASPSPRGKHLGPYRLVTELGSGGMGTVYFAEHREIGHRAAVKVLDPKFADDASVVSRFFDEARAVNAIRHPNIVEIRDYGQDAGMTYLVMELLEGETLSERLEREGRVSLEAACEIVLSVASALQAAHALDIIHRDLKPENVFMDFSNGDERVKVLDFGIAKLHLGGDTSKHTETGTVLGTPKYMSPEQCLGEATLDGRSDVYSLAVLTYEMLVGRPPFEADSFGRYVLAHVHEPPKPPHEVDPDLSAPVSAVLVRALSKHPDDRFLSIEEFADCFSQAVHGVDDLEEPTAETQEDRPAAPTLQTRRLAEKVEQIIDERVARGDLRLPSMPQVSLRALAMLESDEVDFSAVAGVVERDPLVASHLLRVVNSVVYGGKKLRSLRQAIPRLGREPLRELLAQTAARSVFRSRDPRIEASFRTIWEHCLTVAVATRTLAQELEGAPAPETAYLAGLLHDIGKPVVGGFLLELERHLGDGAFDEAVWLAVVHRCHAQVGRMVGARWGLPVEVRDAIGQSAFAPGGRASTRNLVRYANALAQTAGFDLPSHDASGASEIARQGRALLETDAALEARIIKGMKPNVESFYPGARTEATARVSR